MNKMELSIEELSNVAGGDYWTNKGYKFAQKSQYFASNAKALEYAKKQAETLRKKFKAHSLAYMVQVDKSGYYLNYYTK